MKKYHFTVCKDEKHFHRIVKHLKEQGFETLTNWFSLYSAYGNSDRIEPALFWCKEEENSMVYYGHTGYDNVNYTREDICLEIVPEDLFEL